MKHKVFVYGTLRRHEKYHSFLDAAKLRFSQCWTHGRIYDTGLGYPGMVEDKKKKVYGELYRVSDRQLHALDQLEGYHGEGCDHNEYDRVKKTVYTDEGPHEAFTYLYRGKSPKSKQEILSGDWKCYLHLKKPELLYFAYGSCMDQERFKEAGVERLFRNMVGRGVLKGFSLRFTRKYKDGSRADILEIGGRVEGKVYRINQEALWYLFKREGVFKKSYRPTFVDIEMNGMKQRDVVTFTVIDKQEETAPPLWYVKEIIRGGKDTLSSHYIRQVTRYMRDQFNLDISNG